jgi:hypothetical protein
MMELSATRKLAPAIAFALALAAMGCATGPVGSHGVDYIPAFSNSNEGVGR